MSQEQDQTSRSNALLGTMFVHPAFDYVFIGGALSLVAIAVVSLYPGLLPFFTAEDFRYFILFSNSAHFAASTVRLYTKPKGDQSMPIVKVVLPLVALGLVTLCMFRADTLGANLRALYFTWSPYHYAAQAYGLSVMYCYRSGCLLSVTNKRLLWWVAMFPFIANFMLARGAGIHWLDIGGWLDNPTAITFLKQFQFIMPYIAFTAIPLLFWRIWRSEVRPMPLISALMLFTNGIWWVTMDTAQAFVWATIFHGVQYLAIVIIFHVKDQMSLPGNRHGVAYHSLWFYGACFLLGYSLFDWFPRAYIFAGFTPATSVMLTVAMINIHHFIVDSFIWRLKKSDKNRVIVDSGAGAPG
jgi:hypothetical protein